MGRRSETAFVLVLWHISISTHKIDGVKIINLNYENVQSYESLKINPQPFSLAIGRGFQRTILCSIWVLYAKVIKGRSLLVVDDTKPTQEHDVLLVHSPYTYCARL